MPRTKTPKIQVGNKRLAYGTELTSMLDRSGSFEHAVSDPCTISSSMNSTDLFEKKEFTELRKRLEVHGYIYIRGVVDHSDAIAARDMMLAQAGKDGSITCNTPHQNGRLSQRCVPLHAHTTKQTQDHNKQWWTMGKRLLF